MKLTLEVEIQMEAKSRTADLLLLTFRRRFAIADSSPSGREMAMAADGPQRLEAFPLSSRTEGMLRTWFGKTSGA
jgi:hypothetical protein